MSVAPPGLVALFKMIQGLRVSLRSTLAPGYLLPRLRRLASFRLATALSALGPHSIWLPHVRWCYTPERWRVSFKVNTRTRPSSRSSNLITPQFALVIQTGFSSGASRAPIRCRARMQIVPV